MNINERKKSNINFVILSLLIVILIYLSIQVGTQNDFSVQKILIIFISLLLLFIFLPIGIFQGLKKALDLIDYFILSIPYFKINNQIFHCSQCKSILETDDEYCENCGIML